MQQNNTLFACPSVSMTFAFVVSCIVFAVMLLVLPFHPDAMLHDPDTYWHIATGDLIVQNRAIPITDSWSFTASGERWLNASWGWDVLLSVAHHELGWYGVILFNSLTIALSFGLLFFTAFIRSGHGIAAFIALLFMVVSTLALNVRSFQMTYLFLVAWVLILGQVERGLWRLRTLALMPLMMLVWVNMHGGFLAGFSVAGIYGIVALIQRRWSFAVALLVAGLFSIAACLINPYGILIWEATLRTLNSVALPIINEWAPFSFSIGNMFALAYMALFIIALVDKTPASLSEKIVAVAWLVMGGSALRNMPLFGIVALPVIACYLAGKMQPEQTAKPVSQWADDIYQRVVACMQRRAAVAVSLVGALLVCAWMLCPQAQAIYQKERYPLVELSKLTAFIQKNYPQARFINTYNSGGPLIYYTRGAIPVFIDGRTEAAYPKPVVQDYVDFHEAKKGWEKILDKYRIDGIFVRPDDRLMLDRFKDRKGWKRVYEGEVYIFMRDASADKAKKS